MPTARAGLAVGVVGGLLYALGGHDAAGNPLPAVEVYDPSTNTWATKTPMPTPRVWLAAGVLNGVLYAVGGQDANGAPLGTLEAYYP